MAYMVVVMYDENEIIKTIISIEDHRELPFGYDIFDEGTDDVILEALNLMLASKTRERICSFDVLTTNDIAELNHLSKGQASELMTRIKRKGDILGIKGKIHITDYLRFFNVNPGEIYRKENVNAKFSV